MNLIQELQKIGLSDKESKVYLAALELGESSVQLIAKKAGVNRATTYFVLESLSERGLCSTITRDKKTFYIANSPEYLDSFFSLKKKEIDEQQKYFKKFLPELKLISNRELDKPAVKFYEGEQGIVNMVLDFMSKTAKKGDEPMRLVYNKDLLIEKIDDSVHVKLKAGRLQKKIRSKVLYTYEAGELKTTVDGERRKISHEEFPISCDLAIYDDMVRIISLGNRISGLMIKDQAIADTMKSIFDLAWKGTEATRLQDFTRSTR